MIVAELDMDMEATDTPATYTLELRLSLPGSEADIAPARGRVQLEVNSLRAQSVDIVAYGRALTEGVFADPRVRDYFDDALVSAQTLDVPLRLRLAIGAGAPELHSLRWETLQDPD